MQIKLKDIIYPVEVIRKHQNKNTYIRIKENNTIYVTTGTFTSDRRVLNLIHESEEEVLKMLLKNTIKEENRQGFNYLGKSYIIINGDVSFVTFSEQFMYVPNNFNKDKWLDNEAKRIFLMNFKEAYRNFSRQVKEPTISIRKMKSRWGVCNTKKGHITLNYELIHYDQKYLYYVIMHELSHLCYPNHSKDFWGVVCENIPNYKALRKDMKLF